MKKIKVAAIIFGTTFLAEMLVAPLRGYVSMESCAMAGFILQLLVTLYLLRKFSPAYTPLFIILCVFAGHLPIQGLPRFFYFTETLISFPDCISHLLGVCAGFLLYSINAKKFFKSGNHLAKAMFSFSLMLALFISTIGYPMWMHQLTYGNVSGETHEPGPRLINLNDEKSDRFQIKKGKFLVMDFWFVGCGACMDEFPAFQKVYNAYKNNEKLQFFSVNKPFKRYPGDEHINPFTLLKNSGYTFPQATCADNLLTKELGIVAYPTIVVIDTQGDVIFKGNIRDLPSKLKSIL